MVILGDGEMSVADYMRTHRTWNDPPPEAMLERLVKAAIEAAKRDPESQVGGEVSVVKLSANGVQWLRPGACGK